MKKSILLVLMIFLLGSVSAQRDSKMNDLFIKAQFNEVKKSLNLDDATARSLEPLYFDFMEEMRPKEKRIGPTDCECRDEKQVDAHIRARLAMAKNIAVVREKYYDIFRKVLSPSQIMKMYQTERDIMKRVKEEMGERKGEPRRR